MKKEFIKVATAAALSISIFCAGFVSINNFALASALERTDTIPLSSTGLTANIGNTSVLPPPQAEVDTRAICHEEIYIPTPELVVNVIDNGNIPSPNSLSPESAALFAINLVEEMLGYDVNGQYVYLWYSHWPSQTRSHWSGNFSPAPITRYSLAPHVSFTIDSVTGDWIDVAAPVRSMVSPCEMMDEALNAINRDPYRHDEFVRLRRGGGEPPSDLDPYFAAARAYAARFFASGETEVVGMEFRAMGSTGFKLDEDGNLAVAGQLLVFGAIDENGRIADVTICRETKVLFSLFTQHNDIVPGFIYSNQSGRW